MNTTTVFIHLIAGARPNYMKIAPLYKALEAESDLFSAQIIHTGQHYDTNMYQAFFRDFDLPDPHVYLGIGSGSHAQQTAKIMMAYEEVCMQNRPDLTVVVGDVNSTLACALVVKKLNIPLAHLEAGLRSGDREMPEEINRIVTDTLADILWTPSRDADENLRREGIPDGRIRCVGNVMIDSLEMVRGTIERREAYRTWHLEPGNYAVLTLHRPANVDDDRRLRRIIETIISLSEKIAIVFLAHPRTRKRLVGSGLDRDLESSPGVYFAEPLSYIDFMSLVFASRMVITDSGGIQEETTYLNIPCLTLRPNTERPITVTQGTNELVEVDELQDCVSAILKGDWKKATRPDFWDGKSSARIVSHLKEFTGSETSVDRQNTVGE
ncbi:MAG: UDP-N-acetylglucosamine 2-epimerase (non-hydrolyzing) [bacterium]